MQKGTEISLTYLSPRIYSGNDNFFLINSCSLLRFCLSYLEEGNGQQLVFPYTFILLRYTCFCVRPATLLKKIL